MDEEEEEENEKKGEVEEREVEEEEDELCGSSFETAPAWTRLVFVRIFSYFFKKSLSRLIANH